MAHVYKVEGSDFFANHNGQVVELGCLEEFNDSGDTRGVIETVCLGKPINRKTSDKIEVGNVSIKLSLNNSNLHKFLYDAFKTGDTIKLCVALNDSKLEPELDLDGNFKSEYRTLMPVTGFISTAPLEFGEGDVKITFTLEKQEPSFIVWAESEEPEPIEPPAYIDSAEIQGDIKEEATVTAEKGNWTGDALVFGYSWLVDDQEEGTGETFEIPVSSEGSTLKLVITATNDAGSETKEIDGGVIASE